MLKLRFQSLLALLLMNVHVTVLQLCPENLACPSVSNDTVCLNRSQICDGNPDCPSPMDDNRTSADEGGLNGLECESVHVVHYVCLLASEIAMRI